MGIRSAYVQQFVDVEAVDLGRKLSFARKRNRLVWRARAKPQFNNMSHVRQRNSTMQMMIVDYIFFPLFVRR